MGPLGGQLIYIFHSLFFFVVVSTTMFVYGGSGLIDPDSGNKGAIHWSRG